MQVALRVGAAVRFGRDARSSARAGALRNCSGIWRNTGTSTALHCTASGPRLHRAENGNWNSNCACNTGVSPDFGTGINLYFEQVPARFRAHRVHKWSNCGRVEMHPAASIAPTSGRASTSTLGRLQPIQAPCPTRPAFVRIETHPDGFPRARTGGTTSVAVPQGVPSNAETTRTGGQASATHSMRTSASPENVSMLTSASPAP